MSDNFEERWRLRLVGNPAAPLNQDWFFFGSEAECLAAVRDGKYGDIPEVLALGEHAWFDVTHMIRALPSVSAPPPPPPPPPVPPPPPPAPPPGVSSACAALYPAGFTLSTARTTDMIASLVKPAKGSSFADPAYKPCVTRATDHAAEGISGFVRNDYSRRQAFNADSSRYLGYSFNGAWHVYDANTYAHIKALPGPAADAEIQWSATNPDVLYYTPTNGIGMKLNELTVSSGVSRVVGDFAARLKAKWPSANAAWTKSEGSPSKDGRYWCFMVDNTSWGSVGLFTWDRDTDTIVGTMDTNGDRPDHVSMSPSGNYCVVSWTSAKGTVAFTRDFSSSQKVHTTSEHSDLAIDANGDDAYVSIDYQSAAGDVFMVNLRTGQRTTLLPTYLSGSATAMHISGKGFNKPGWVVISTYANTTPVQWFHNKVVAVQLKASPTIYNLAFHRSVYNGYWTEPHATVNREFTRVLFNSNWGVNTDTDVDAYMIQLPVGVLK